MRGKQEERNKEEKENTRKEWKEFSWCPYNLKCTFWVQKWNKVF
jgi:hypothetical protein